MPSAIERARVVLLVFSRDANASEWIPRELQAALYRHKRIIPFRIANVEPSKSLELYVRTLQYVEGFPGPIEQHLPRIVEHLRQVLGIQRPIEPQPKPPQSVPAKATPVLAPPQPKRSGVLYGLIGVVTAMALVGALVFDLVWQPSPPPPVSQAALPSPEAECGTEGDVALREGSPLPGLEPLDGAYEVVTVNTLRVRYRIVKLDGVGGGGAEATRRLTDWMRANGETVHCVPVNAALCKYTCYIGPQRANIANFILEQKLAPAAPP